MLLFFVGPPISCFNLGSQTYVQYSIWGLIRVLYIFKTNIDLSWNKVVIEYKKKWSKNCLKQKATRIRWKKTSQRIIVSLLLKHFSFSFLFCILFFLYYFFLLFFLSLSTCYYSFSFSSFSLSLPFYYLNLPSSQLGFYSTSPNSLLPPNKFTSPTQQIHYSHPSTAILMHPFLPSTHFIETPQSWLGTPNICQVKKSKKKKKVKKEKIPFPLFETQI